MKVFFFFFFFFFNVLALGQFVFGVDLFEPIWVARVHKLAFWCGRRYFGSKNVVLFFNEKCEKLELHYKTAEIHQWVVISRGSHPNVF